MITKDEIQKAVREAILGGIAERISADWLYKYCINTSPEIEQLHQRIEAQALPSAEEDALNKLVWQAEDIAIKRFLQNGMRAIKLVLEDGLKES